MKPNLTLKSSLLSTLLGCAIFMGGAQANTVNPSGGTELKEIGQMSEQGQQGAALERVNKYLVDNPKDAEAMFMKGVILVEQNKREEAIKTFIEITDKYPGLPEPYNNLAVLYADQGDFDKARKALETAIKTHPSYATAHENLGDIYARLASSAYDKAIKLDNSNARAQGKLAMITDLFGNGKNVAVASKNTAPMVKDTGKQTAALAKPMEIKKAALKPVAEKPVAPAASSVTEDDAILAAVNRWASAWSAKDLNQYLASYADSFKTPKGESRGTWEKTRRERVGRPANISVSVNSPTVLVEDDSATVKFSQTYKADGKPQSTLKTLRMKKVNNTWLIDQEIAGR